MFNRPVQVHQPPNQPQPNWDIHHVQVNTAKYKMRMWPDPAWQSLIDDLLFERPFQRAVIYTHQEFTDKVESIVDGFGLEEGQQIKVDYFHKKRGENTYKDFDLIRILGQAGPQEVGLVAKYRAFQPRDSFINDDKQARPHRRKFKNPDLQHYKESKQYGELRQASYRIRPSTTDHPLGNKLILVTAFDVPELTDVPRDNIRKTAPQQMKGFYARVKKAEERRTRLSDLIESEISELGFFVSSDKFRRALTQSLSSFDRLEGCPNNNIGYIGRISEHFSCTDRTVRNDVNLVIGDLDLPRHEVSVRLDGKSWPLTVYGDLERWEQTVERLTPPLEPAEANVELIQHLTPPPCLPINLWMVHLRPVKQNCPTKQVTHK